MKALPNVQTGGGFSQSIAHLWICSKGKRRPIDSQTAPWTCMPPSASRPHLDREKSKGEWGFFLLWTDERN
jgi:hypothetical protein